jgi:hypothetical protein
LPPRRQRRNGNPRKLKKFSTLNFHIIRKNLGIQTPVPAVPGRRRPQRFRQSEPDSMTRLPAVVSPYLHSSNNLSAQRDF